MLKDVVEKAGYSNIKVNYFLFFLFPLAVISRMKQKVFKGSSTDLKPMNPIVNKILYKIFSFEKKLVNRFKIPFGLSVILTAEK